MMGDYHSLSRMAGYGSVRGLGKIPDTYLTSGKKDA